MTDTPKTTDAAAKHGNPRDDASRGAFDRGERSGRRTVRKAREPRQRSEYDHKIVSIRRVTRVVAGGRRFNFSVAVVIGNGKGTVGVGLGKAGDTAQAIEKAMQDAKKHVVRIPLTKDGSIPSESSAKYAATEIIMFPAPGKGLKAGSAVRTVLELAGVKHVSAKVLSRSKNRLNNARATIAALSKVRPSRRRSTETAGVTTK